MAPKTDHGSLKSNTESDTRIFEKDPKDVTQFEGEQPTDTIGTIKREPIVNTVYAESRQKVRSIQVNPSEIKKSLENLKRDEELERRGLT